MICVAIPGPSNSDISEQIQKVLDYADIIELRIDLFKGIDAEFLTDIKKQYLLPFIFTLQVPNSFKSGSEEEIHYQKQIKLLAALNPAYLDIDFRVAQSFLSNLKQLYPQITFILSYHNFDEIPPDLQEIYQEMCTKPADLIKIAVKANSIIDTLQTIKWAQNKNIILTCMGELGEISRILNPILGSHFTYACVSSDLQTAEGQVTAQELVEIYAFKRINCTTKLFGLIGGTIQQSLSQYTHNDYFQMNGINAIYVKMVVQIEEIAKFLQLATVLGFRGLSVTIPLKAAVIPYLDEPSLEVKTIGACNTIMFQNNKIMGFNTDGTGALNVLESHVKVAKKTLVILGAGGAAKAIAYEAMQRGAKVVILNRTLQHAKDIATQLGCAAGTFTDFKYYAAQGYNFLINSTPVSPQLELVYLLHMKIVMDINTKTVTSPFIELAKQKKCQVIYGYEMFIEQAMGQFTLWFKQVDQMKGRTLLISKIKKLLNFMSNN